MEENERMGKTRDLVQKIRDTKGIFLFYIYISYKDGHSKGNVNNLRICR